MWSLKTYIIALVASICLLFAVLVGTVLTIQIICIEDVSKNLKGSMHARAIDSVTHSLEELQHISRMLRNDFLHQKLYRVGPPYNEYYKPLVTYALEFPHLALFSYCGDVGYIVELRKGTLSGPTDVINISNPPLWKTEWYTLKFNRSLDLNVEYVYAEYNTTTNDRAYAPDENFWTGSATPDDGLWLIYYNVRLQAMMLSFAMKMVLPNGTYVGINYAEYTLSGLSEKLNKQVNDDLTRIIIIDYKWHLMASNMDEIRTARETKPVNESSDAVTKAVGAYLQGRADAGKPLKPGESVSVVSNGNEYMVSTTQIVFEKEKNHNWTIVLAMPRTYFFALSDAGMTASIVIVIVMFLAVLVFSFVFANSLAKHIKHIVDQIDGIVTYDDRAFSTSARGSSRSLFKVAEVTTMQNSVTRMKTILQSFEKYIPVQLLRYLVKKNEPATLGLQRSSASVMFLDIANFTSLMEQLPLDRLIEQFTEYSNEAMRVIVENHGTLDKMIGDGIMAFFGCPPTPMKNHQYWAARCALSLQRMMVQLRAKWEKEGKATFFIRVGIASGPVMVGNVGSSHRFQYTVLGDVVNLASRMEGLNKYFGTYVLVTGHTFEPLDKHKFIGRELATVRVKGKSNRTRAYELVTCAENFDPSLISARPLTAGTTFTGTAFTDRSGTTTNLDEAPATSVTSCRSDNLDEAPASSSGITPRHLEGSLVPFGGTFDERTPKSPAPFGGTFEARTPKTPVSPALSGVSEYTLHSPGLPLQMLPTPTPGTESRFPRLPAGDPLFIISLPAGIREMPPLVIHIAELCAIFTRAVRCYETRRFEDASRLLHFYRSANHTVLRDQLNALEGQNYQEHLGLPLEPPMTPQDLVASFRGAGAARDLEGPPVEGEYSWELLKQCEKLRAEPPPEDWDPVVTMTEK